jgi:glutamyl-tRNA(Gln) amidotransferase subunit D
MRYGDYVKLRLAKKEIEGTVLESYDKSIVLVKLRSGYNIGVPKENVLDSKVVKRFKEKEESFRIPFRKGKPFIGLVVTGGTMASRLDSRTGGVTALTSVEGVARIYPKLFEKCNVRVESPFMKMSNDMSYQDWIEIAKVVKKMLDDKEIEGVIVTHGTDFLGYTSAALSFMLRDLNKPVVLTYSQRSIDRASSDAEFNLECAASMALSDCAEVVLVGHGSMNDDFCYAHSGTKVRKLHTSRRDAFKSVNAKPIAKVFLDGRIEFLGQRRPRNNEEILLDDFFSDKVALVKFYPGQKPDILDYYKNKGVKGIILEVGGLGQVASSKAKHGWISKLRQLIKSGVVICAAAQTINGRLNPRVYSAGRELEDLGVVFLEDMLAETAFVKLSWVLGHRTWRSPSKVREKMLENISGEFNEFSGTCFDGSF